MRISRIEITNFRNFRHLDVAIGQHAVIVGENKIGKSNLLFALQILLDPSLPDSDRHLRLEDFWDGLDRPLTADRPSGGARHRTTTNRECGINRLIAPSPRTQKCRMLWLGAGQIYSGNEQFLLLNGLASTKDHLALLHGDCVDRHKGSAKWDFFNGLLRFCVRRAA